MITKKNIKILWARSAGRSSFPECEQKLILEDFETSDQIIGEVVHIIAKSEKGPPGTINFTPEYLNSYENLILLCPNHHRFIDSFPEKSNLQMLTISSLLIILVHRLVRGILYILYNFGKHYKQLWVWNIFK